MEEDVLRCLEGRGSVQPVEIAGKLGMSEAAATSLLAILAREGKVKISSVEAA
ncbi:MAG TPA: FaeA/PapI family transcriptional regulator [Solirubrobacteraceae bacterium]|jgi:DNA-binding MarR family transcriptional regulator